MDTQKVRAKVRDGLTFAALSFQGIGMGMTLPLYTYNSLVTAYGTENAYYCLEFSTAYSILDLERVLVP